jgi:hypothetical protein
VVLGIRSFLHPGVPCESHTCHNLGLQAHQLVLDPSAVPAAAGAGEASTKESSRGAVAAVLHTVTSLVP